MPTLNIFVSFEFDKDKDLQNNFYQQAKQGTNHRIRDCSLHESYPDEAWKLDFTHFKRHKRGNLQYDGTEWRGVSVHRSWRSIVKNPPTPTTSGYAQR